MHEVEIYRQLFQRNPQPMWVYDLETLRFLAVNAAATRHYGWSEQEFLAMTILQIRPPEEAARVADAVRGLQGGPRSFGIWRHQRKDGSIIEVEVSGDAIEWKGRPARLTLVHDVTARRLAEAETRRLGERLTATVESITDAFYTLDREFRVTFMNRAAETVMGPRETLLGKNLWEAFPPAVGTIAETSYRRALAENRPVEFDIHYEPLDRRFEVRAFPSNQGLAVYFHDITAQHRANEAVRVAEERFRLLSRATNDAVWDWDILTDRLWWGDGFESHFGYDRSELDTTVNSWTAHIHPADRDRVTIGLHDIVDQGGNVWLDEYRFQRRDGTWTYVRDRGYVIRDEDGRPIRMVGGMTDLTAQHRAEETIVQQASLIDAARDAIVLRDTTHRIISWNQGAERIYGWTAAEAIGRPFDALLKPDRARFLEADTAVRSSGAWTGEIRKTAKSGEVLTLDCRWTLLPDAAGGPSSILSIDTDITERKRLEQLFLRAQRMESIGTLAGGIAHDLNNVLTPIMMSIELLKMDEKDPEKLETLSTIEAATRQGSDMVRQVLSFARGVEGRRIEIAPAHLLRDIEKIVSDTFLKSIAVRTHTGGGLWHITGDATQLHQVLLNLCVNARDAMPTGGTLTLSVANVQVDEGIAGVGAAVAPGPYVCFTVEDTGFGMTPEVVERIFDPFFTTKEVGKGTGLGLSTSLGIVRSHDGFIRVYSEPGRGTTFKVYLPGHSERTGTPEARAALALPRGNGELVLIVDDEASVRQITRQTLEAFGYRVLAAGDGGEAVAMFADRQKEIALVVTDMNMPVMDGAALIHVLHRMNPAVRIVAASGLDASSLVARAADSGVRRFLPKPYTAEILLTTIREALQDPPPASPPPR